MESFLTAEEREELRRRHRKEGGRRTADRMKAVLLADRGWSHRQIAEALLLDDDTVARHVKEFKDGGKLEISSGGSESKLSEEQASELVEHLRTMTYCKAKDICAHVLAVYGVVYTVPGMTSWLKNNGFSYIKPHGVPAKADPIKQTEFVEEYKRLKEETPAAEPILFVDGVHPTMATKVAYGWIKKGTRKAIATNATRTRLNIVGAINLDSMEAVIRDFLTINSSSMADFFGALRTKYPSAKKIHVILDNGPYNKSEETKAAATNHGIVLHFLPTYSPNLNPIERLWKLMNEHARNNKVFRSVKDFKDSIFQFFDWTWPSVAQDARSRINDHFHIPPIPTLSG
jgi:transposase